MREMGHGRGYQYDHAFAGHYSGQQHLPDKLANRRYYNPGALGYEQRIAEWLEKLRGTDGRSS
jgi:putative ATPase